MTGIVERLVAHPRLPFVAGLAADRAAVHIFDGTGPQHLATVGADAPAYGDADRSQQAFGVAWHPVRPVLLVTDEGRVTRWTPAGLSEVEGLPAGRRYRWLAYSPGGERLWAAPADDDWSASDVIDLDGGTVSTGPPWDTGMAVHPAGGLALTYIRDQPATLGIFARVGADGVRRPVRRALVLDCDGYEAPVFSGDGNFFVVRGNAYENMVEVFEFPSLRRVLSATLAEAAAPHNVAFTGRRLWVGQPDGRLVGIDLDGGPATERRAPGGTAVSALATLSTGDLLVATVDGRLTRRPGHRATGDPALVRGFLDATTDLPDDVDDLWEELELADGDQTWEPGEVAAVTTADDTDPTWLRLQASVNSLFRTAGTHPAGSRRPA